MEEKQAAMVLSTALLAPALVRADASQQGCESSKDKHVFEPGITVLAVQDGWRWRPYSAPTQADEASPFAERGAKPKVLSVFFNTNPPR